MKKPHSFIHDIFKTYSKLSAEKAMMSSTLLNQTVQVVLINYKIYGNFRGVFYENTNLPAGKSRAGEECWDKVVNNLLEGFFNE